MVGKTGETALDFKVGQDRFERMAEAIPALVFVRSVATGKTEYVNRSLSEFLGLADDVVLGPDLVETHIHPDDQERARVFFRSLTAAGDPDSDAVALRFRGVDDAYFTCLSTYSVFERDAQGQPTRIIGTLRNIEDWTSRRLSHANSLLKAISDATPCGIIGLDQDGQVASINLAGRHMLAHTSEDVPFSWPDAVKFADAQANPQPCEQSPLSRAMNGETLHHEVFAMLGPNRKVSFVSISTTRIASTHQEVGTVIVMDDITQQEKQRQQIERSSRLDALGQLTGGIAHDFNNMLATIGYALQIGLNSDDEEKKKRVLATAQLTIEKGSDLTSRLLAFAKRQPGTQSSLKISDVFASVTSLAERLIEESVEISVTEEAQDLWVFCDAHQLENAVLNLILNARDSVIEASGGGKIALSARAVDDLSSDPVLRQELPDTHISGGIFQEDQDGGLLPADKTYRYIDISVSDNGRGMSDAVKRRAIDPFFSTKSSSSGTGLGLSTIYGFVRQSGGELRIFSKPDQGATVRMVLPRGTSEGLRDEPIAKEAGHLGGGEHILVVEDEADLRDVMVEVLQSYGYQAEGVGTGKDALAALSDGRRIDAVVTDIVMPGGMSGFELAVKVRALRPDMPILYMSGFAGFIDEAEMSIAAPMMRKPTPPSELVAFIHDALESGSPTVH